MSFVVNGAEWSFDETDSEEIRCTIERFLAFVEDTIALGQAVSIGDDFQTRPMRGELALWDLFARDAGVALPGELGQAMAAWLGRAGLYLDEDPWPEGADDTMIAIGDIAAAANPDVAWVHHKVRAAIPSACVTLGASRVLETVTAEGSASVHFVCDDGSRRGLWRDAIILEGDNIASLRRYAFQAYPDLHFAVGALESLGNLSGGYLAARRAVQRTFAVLDDDGSWAFTWPPPRGGPGRCASP